MADVNLLFLLIISRPSFSHLVVEVRQREERDALNFPLIKEEQ